MHQNAFKGRNIRGRFLLLLGMRSGLVLTLGLVQPWRLQVSWS